MSNYAKTTDFLAKDSLPDADPDKIIRGSEFDTEFNNLVTAVATKANITSPTFGGVPTVPTAAANINNLQIASTAYVTTAISTAVPSGIILMWSGSIATIPIGWLICDGLNSTPNLKNRFVLGAGDTYAVAATGGSADAVVVSHTHTATSTVTDPGHLHSSANEAPGNAAADGAGYKKALNGSTGTATTGITVATTNATTGVSGTNANLPPYYALAYIMKS